MSKDKSTIIHVFLLVITLAVFIWSIIKPKEGYPVLALELLPSVIVLVSTVFFYNKFRLTTLSYFIITILSILTFIGGHYSYSKVPLFNWIKDYFDLQRNHYDRFGHFLKGMIVIIIREILLRRALLPKGKWLNSLSISITLSIGALYEIIEWASTKISIGEKITKDFLGMQGDKWDAQWDMMLLLIGSIIALFLCIKLHNKLLQKRNKD